MGFDIDTKIMGFEIFLRVVIGIFIILNITWGFTSLYKKLSNDKTDNFNDLNILMQVIWGIIFVIVIMCVMGYFCYQIGSIFI